MNDNAEREITDRFLRHLAANGDNPGVRELADQVLQGTISLSQGLNAPAYADALAPGLAGFTQWYDTLSDDQRSKEASDCATRLSEFEARRDDGQPHTNSST